MNEARRIPGDWYDGVIPEGVRIDPTAHVDSSYAFHRYRSELVGGVEIARGASVYTGSLFDTGPRGRIRVGEYAMLNGTHLCCDSEITIGPFCLISWQVLLIDSLRAATDIEARRRQLADAAKHHRWTGEGDAKPISVGANVWIGFESCILPGVSIGEGSVIAARSVVFEDVPRYCVFGGNPALLIRHLPKEEGDAV